MKTNRNYTKSLIRLLAVSSTSLLVLSGVIISHAADGIWTGDVAGSWTNSANWVGGIIADGPDSTAYFTNDVTAIRIVTLDANRTIGNLRFGDSDTSSTGGWVLTNSTITLSNTTVSTPTIAVSAMVSGSDVTNQARIASVIAGAQGYIKNGPGTLTVAANNTLRNNFGPYAVQINEGAIAGFGLTSVAAAGLPMAFDGGTFIYHGPNNFPNTNIVLSTGTLVKTNSPNGDVNSMLFGDGTKVWNMVLPNNNLMPNGFTTAGTSNQYMNFSGTINLLGGWKQDPTNFFIWRANPGGGAHPYYGSSTAILNMGSTDDIRFRVRGTLTTAGQRMIWGAVNGGVLARLQGSFQADNVLTVYEIGSANVPCTFSGTIENGYNLGAPSSVRPTALTKTGTSTFTLEGTNTYTGNTLISGGTLKLNATAGISNSPSISLSTAGSILDVSAFSTSWTNAAGQVLGGIGTVNGSVSMESGGLVPGIGTGIGTLSFANNLSLSGTLTNAFDVGFSATNDKVLITGNLSLAGSLPLRINPLDGAISNGTYVLFKWGGTLSGSSGNLSLEVPSLPGTFSLGQNLTTKEIYLQVTNVAIQNIVWRGDAGPNWDIATTANWRNTNGSSVTFSNFNNVKFDNTGSNTAPVNITQTVNPLSVLVDSTNDYVFSGSGKITGAGDLTKRGGGKLTVLTANDYSGDSVINDGTLQIGNGGTSGTLGAGAVTINTNGMLKFQRSDTVTYSQSIVGDGTLAQDGTNGTLILTANSANNGGILVSAGTLQLGDGTGLQGSVLSTITNNATLRYYHDTGDATINNTLAGNGVVNYEFASGSRTYTYADNASSPGFSGTINVGIGVRLHANTGNNGLLFGNGSQVVATNIGAQAWVDTTAITNYNQSFVIAGNGWTGDTVPAAAPGLGALRLFNCTLTGPITMIADSRIAGSSAGARIEGLVSGGANQLEIYASGASPDQFVLTLAPTNGTNTWGNTLVTRGGIQAGNPNGISTNAMTITGEGRLRLNGNNISISTLLDGAPVNGTNCLVLNMNTTNAAALTVGANGSSSTFQGIFGDGASQPLGLTKAGAGSLTLTANSTNTGPVTVTGGTLALSGSGSFSNSIEINVGSGAVFDVNGRSDQTLILNSGQTLKGRGTVSGKVNALAGSTVSPGGSVGTLTISSDLTLTGTLLMELNRTNGSQTNDLITVSGSFTSTSGSLFVTNIGPALAAGNFFQLFGSGRSFASVTLQTNDPANNATYVWNNTIASNGRITVQSVGTLVNPNPTNITVKVNGSNIELSWPADHIGWKLQAQTNLSSAGLKTNWVDVPGSISVSSVTNAIDRSNGTVFYRMVLP